MNRTPNASRFSRFAFPLAFAGLAAFAFVFVSGRSFWLDEVRTGAKAVQTTFSAFCAEMSKTGGSDVQMPLYMAAVWAWARLFGTSEFALRSINALFNALALLVVAACGTLPRRVRLLWGAAITTAPLLAFYLDEARPYSLLALGGTTVAAALASPPARGLPAPRDVRLLLAGCVLLSAASLTGAAFAAWPCLWLLWRAVESGGIRSAVSSHPFAVPAAVLALVALAAFFAWTLAAGFRGTMSYSTDWRTIGFCGYEFLGAAGIGPGRAQLRAEGLSALSPFAPELAVFFAILIMFAVVAVRSGALGSDSSPSLPLLTFCASGCAILLLGGVCTHLRIVGRHLIPALPAFLLAVALCADRCIESGKILPRTCVALAFAAWTFSAFSLRFAGRHEKEDDRAAAAMAKRAAEAGQTAWWGGDKWTFEYYPRERADASGKILVLQLESGALPKPDTALFLAKFDISDPDGARRAAAEKAGLKPVPGMAPRGYAAWSAETANR